MMATQPFPTQHHGGMPHPGMPHGQPMGHGQHPGMAGMAPGMMHPGVSGPQGSQGPMGTGMPPGAPTPAPGGPMPNAHAMSHLGPQQQQHMFQPGHPQMAQFNNQMMQQHMLRQRQMQMMMQQQVHGQPGHVPVTMPGGAQGMNQAQLAALRAGQMQGHPGMPFQQMPGQGGGQPGNPQMQNPQHQQLLVQQAHFANQQAALQHQQQQAAQARNNQMMQEQNNTSQPPPPQPTPTPQAAPPPQPTPQPQPAQPTQGPQPPSQPQNQSQPQPQQQPQTQGQSSQQQRDPQQAAQDAQLQERQNQANNLATMMRNQQRISNGPLRGAHILRLLQFADKLHKDETNPREASPRDLKVWQDFVANFFTSDACLRQQLWSSRGSGDKRFQLAAPALPRYYWKHFTNGVKHIQLHIAGARENEIAEGHFVTASVTTNYIFGNGVRVIAYGDLRATFDNNNKIDFLDISTKQHVEYVPRQLVEQALGSPEMKQSPEMNKKMKKAQAKQPPPTIPSAPVNEWGIPLAVLELLEIGEVFTNMERVMAYHKENPQLRPQLAMEQVVALDTMAQNAGMGPGINPAMQQLAAGQRTPGLNGPNAFNSPAMAHLGLPQQNSPAVGVTHTPSPHQAHMAGPVAMAHQQSQQGSNLSGSQGASANTSPNIAGKKRRASAVKVEGEDGGNAEVNGVGGASKVKPSPRIGGKRQKGTA